MAIKVNYDYSGDLYPGAYVKVQKIVLTSNTIEKFEEQEDGSQVLKYYTTPENSAFIFVYPDQEARSNSARPIHFFGIQFDYDIDSGENIYKVAYQALKRLERFKDEIIEDV